MTVDEARNVEWFTVKFPDAAFDHKLRKAEFKVSHIHKKVICLNDIAKEWLKYYPPTGSHLLDLNMYRNWVIMGISISTENKVKEI